MYHTLIMLLRNMLDQRLELLVLDLIRALSALNDHGIRQARFTEWLMSYPDTLAVEMLEKLLRGLQEDRAHFRHTLAALLDLAPLKAALGDEGVSRWAELARAQERGLALALLNTDPPHKRYYARHQMDVNEQLEDRPLGWRKTLARATTRQVLDRMLYERHPEVVAILLNNPRVLERDVIKMAAMQPTSEYTLRAIFAHARWIRRYPVKKALVFNPYTPPHIALGQLTFLLEQDLKAASTTRRLSPQVRAHAQALLLERRARRRAPHALPTLVDPRGLSPNAGPNQSCGAESGQAGSGGLEQGALLAQAFLDSLSGTTPALALLEQEALSLELISRHPPPPPPEVLDAPDDALDEVARFLADLPDELELVPVGNDDD